MQNEPNAAPVGARPPPGQQRNRDTKGGAWALLKRTIAFSVAAALSALILTSTLPPLVADQSDRAIVNAPVTLLTAPIGGEVVSVAATPGATLDAGARVAEVVNNRVDRSTLITLEGKKTDTEENLLAIRAKKASDTRYVQTLTEEIGKQSAIVISRYEQQIVDLEAQVRSAGAAEEEKKQVVGHQGDMVARGVAAPEMIKAATQQYNVSRFQRESTEAKLLEKRAQLDSARKALFVGDDVHDLAALIQKRRDMDLDLQRLGIEEHQVAAAREDQLRLLEAERGRLASLQRSSVDTPGAGEVLSVEASVGRHVSAGDTLARMVDCGASFVVAIFSYRQGADLAVGARVSIDGGSAGARDGTIVAVLPKTSDKVDETYAVPFPQTERRELYVLVRPDSPLRSTGAGKGRDQCDIGAWVTVTRNNGWVPSLSMIWRAAGARVASGIRGSVDHWPAALTSIATWASHGLDAAHDRMFAASRPADAPSTLKVGAR